MSLDEHPHGDSTGPASHSDGRHSATRQGKPWTTREHAVVLAQFPAGGANACMPQLPGRSRASVVAYATRQGLRSTAVRQAVPVGSDRPSERREIPRGRAPRTTVVSTPTDFPPRLNAFGLVGQHQLVDTLTDLIEYTQRKGRRFPDRTLLAGPGEGKSTLALAIAARVAGGNCLLLNGADIREPETFVDAIGEHGWFGDQSDGVYDVIPCVIFVDEAHALGRKALPWLLSATDDNRVTSYNGKRFSTARVTFLLATTDVGKLPTTLQQRAAPLRLTPYTLDEVAGIVTLHARSELEGATLPYDVCAEVAARTCANPRCAVRAIRDAIIPHASSAFVRGHGREPDQAELLAALTPEVVASYFTRMGVDENGLDEVSRRLLVYLDRHGVTPADRLCQALAITTRSQFVGIDEYLARLGLVAVSTRGRQLTATGQRYVRRSFSLRSRISQAAPSVPTEGV